MIPFEVIALSPYAREMLAEIASRRVMRRFHDATQRFVEIRAWQAEDWSALTALYDTFFIPGARVPAFPPLNAQQRARWLEELTTRGPNLIARVGNHVVGHAALVAYDRRTSHELVVFVHPEYRGAGIGGALLDALLQWAPREGVSRIWLVADRSRGASAALYESRGFRRDVDHVPGRELWTIHVVSEQAEQWQRAASLVSAVATATRVRLQALLRAVRLAMIPLVCAIIIAVASSDRRGRTLAIILALSSLVFGLIVQIRSIVFGESATADVPDHVSSMAANLRNP